ncbi:MAG: Cof-type HAD-IIB family hydrolase [Clostridiales Family XIII bacterium]|jgi:Cof subfamily protein (haloacid dehalogenase superfamily)|nr:Cof-type HAD-IIB family hydrolase [Clostridiales Family XIII bacterium]
MNIETFRLFAIDIDDTLISDYKPVSEEDRNAVRAASDAGVNVILASGRGYDGVKPYNQALGLPGYSICTGGGQIYDANNRLVHSTHIRPDNAQGLLKWAKERNIYTQVYLDDGYYYSEYTDWSEYYLSHCGYPGKLVANLSDRTDLHAAKIVFFDKPEKIEAFTPLVRDAFPSLNVLTSAPIFLEIFDPAVSKGAALKYVSKMLDISREEIASIGDSQLDISMFECSGLGCAVPDASNQVKAAADYICQSPANWVAEVIDKFMR